LWKVCVKRSYWVSTPVKRQILNGLYSRVMVSHHVKSRSHSSPDGSERERLLASVDIIFRLTRILTEQ